MKTIIDTRISVGIATTTRRRISLNMVATEKRARRRPRAAPIAAAGRRCGGPPPHRRYLTSVTPFRRTMPSGYGLKPRTFLPSTNGHGW